MLGKQLGGQDVGQLRWTSCWLEAADGQETLQTQQKPLYDRSPVQQFLAMITSVCKLKRQPPPHLLIQIKTNPRAQPVTATTTALSIARERKASAIGGLGSSVHGGAGGFAQHNPALLSKAGVLEVPA